jgi:hypothetical protein
MQVHFPELSLAELLDDPLVHLLMASDGVKDTALRSLIQTIRHARRTMKSDRLADARARNACNHVPRRRSLARSDADSGAADLTTYWVFLLDRQGTIRSFKALECANDQDALAFAREAFARAPQCRGFELWQENRRIHLQMRSSADRVAPNLSQAGRQR